MTHYGIWIKAEQRWLVSGTLDIFWTTSWQVAVEQLKGALRAGRYEKEELEVKEFAESRWDWQRATAVRVPQGGELLELTRQMAMWHIGDGDECGKIARRALELLGK